ncbi:NAD(P)-binding protein [Cutaneotrichosporon oleaginosum]|uniref:NAD(P)-binding protein n=1 Tax=Cutaneotrichosporon oleaginosum TaxID=879819 RepID=A0A0J1B7X4_9TREE|nr:NAD(P)-binding protein [Cutaneotrichosporon oleaginosum]KLT43874.1 NAD(P)-binding protein [Cutaneotrichosporon oleaginosum]TXT06386.1 hypothetical protein COLE_05717 [Cutaneotrichosporon oleaginosum]
MPPLDFFISQWTPLPASPKGHVLRGKTVILTGANSGIGLAAAHQLAALEPDHLILACRNIKTGEAALASVCKQSPHVNAAVWELDLASFASVKAFAERANTELDRVDVAILNAGISPNRAAPMKTTEDGHEATHQVNVLATILLALLLAPALHRSPAPHLVITSSEVHGWADPAPIIAPLRANRPILTDFDDRALYIGHDRYFVSKLLLQLIVRRLIPALPRVVIASVNPGMCATNLMRDVSFSSLADLRELLPFAHIMPFMRGAGRGAAMVVLAAVAPESAEYWHVGVAASAPSVFMATMSGMRAGDQYFAEVMALCERVAPGSTAVLQR